MEENKKQNKPLVVVLLLITIAAVLVGTSYAYWILTKTQRDSNKLVAACLDFELINAKTDGEGHEITSFSIDNAYPMTNIDGITDNEGYSFKVKNKCDDAVSYYIALGEYQPEFTSAQSNYEYIENKNIKVALNDNLIGVYSSLPGTEIPADAEDMTMAKVIGQDTLAGNQESKVYTVKAWLKNDAPDSERSTSSVTKTWKSKIFVTGTLAAAETNNSSTAYISPVTGDTCFDINDDGVITNYHSEKTECVKKVVIPAMVNNIPVKEIATNAFRKRNYYVPDDVLYADATDSLIIDKSAADSRTTKSPIIEHYKKYYTAYNGTSNELIKVISQNDFLSVFDERKTWVNETNDDNHVSYYYYDAYDKYGLINNGYDYDMVLDNTELVVFNLNGVYYATPLVEGMTLSEATDIVNNLYLNNSTAASMNLGEPVLYANNYQDPSGKVLFATSAELEANNISFEDANPRAVFLIYKAVNVDGYYLSNAEFEALPIDDMHFNKNGVYWDDYRYNNEDYEQYFVAKYYKSLTTYSISYDETINPNIKYYVDPEDNTKVIAYTNVKSLPSDLVVDVSRTSVSLAVSSVEYVDNWEDVPSTLTVAQPSYGVYIEGKYSGNYKDFKSLTLTVTDVDLSHASFLEKIDSLAFTSLEIFEDMDLRYSNSIENLYFGDNNNPIELGYLSFANSQIDELEIYNTLKRKSLLDFIEGFEDVLASGNIDSLSYDEQQLLYAGGLSLLAQGEFSDSHIETLKVKKGDDLGIINTNRIFATEEMRQSLSEGDLGDLWEALLDIIQECGMFSMGEANNIIIEEGITGVGSGVFALINVENISLPSTIEKLGKWSFVINSNDGYSIKVNMSEEEFSNVEKDEEWLGTSHPVITFDE